MLIPLILRACRVRGKTAENPLLDCEENVHRELFRVYLRIAPVSMKRFWGQYPISAFKPVSQRQRFNCLRAYSHFHWR
jgi:hypothetical protein